MCDDSYVEAWDEGLFPPHNPNKQSKESAHWSFIEVLTQSQIDSRLEVARWIHSKHVNLINRDYALRCVSLLLRNNPVAWEFIKSSLKPRYHADLDRRLAKCRRIDESATFVNSTEEVYLLGVSQILEILESHNVIIPNDVDDFILKLSCVEDFREGILNGVREKNDREEIENICTILLENELEEGVINNAECL